MVQKKKTGEKQPKETDKIKKKLERVATLKRRIDNLIERLEYLESTMAPLPLQISPGCRAVETAPAKQSAKLQKSWNLKRSSAT